MMRSVRIWVTELDPNVPVGDWGPDHLVRSFGEGAAWRYEPTYWAIRGLPDAEARDDGGYVDHWLDLTVDQARELDATFRAAVPAASRCGRWGLGGQFAVMDRALGPGSPFTRFMVVEYEWETGLPD